MKSKKDWRRARARARFRFTSLGTLETKYSTIQQFTVRLIVLLEEEEPIGRAMLSTSGDE